MKRIYSYALKAATILLLTITVNACEPEYAYCNNGVIEITNMTGYTVYYSLRSDLCNTPLYDGETVTIDLGQIQSNINHPDSEQFNYIVGIPGYAENYLDIEITECYTSIILD